MSHTLLEPYSKNSSASTSFQSMSSPKQNPLPKSSQPYFFPESALSYSNSNYPVSPNTQSPSDKVVQSNYTQQPTGYSSLQVNQLPNLYQVQNSSKKISSNQSTPKENDQTFRFPQNFVSTTPYIDPTQNVVVETINPSISSFQSRPKAETAQYTKSGNQNSSTFPVDLYKADATYQYINASKSLETGYGTNSGSTPAKPNTVNVLTSQSSPETSKYSEEKFKFSNENYNNLKDNLKKNNFSSGRQYNGSVITDKFDFTKNPGKDSVSTATTAASSSQKKKKEDAAGTAINPNECSFGPGSEIAELALRRNSIDDVEPIMESANENPPKNFKVFRNPKWEDVKRSSYIPLKDEDKQHAISVVNLNELILDGEDDKPQNSKSYILVEEDYSEKAPKTKANGQPTSLTELKTQEIRPQTPNQGSELSKSYVVQELSVTFGASKQPTQSELTKKGSNGPEKFSKKSSKEIESAKQPVLAAPDLKRKKTVEYQQTSYGDTIEIEYVGVVPNYPKSTASNTNPSGYSYSTTTSNDYASNKYPVTSNSTTTYVQSTPIVYSTQYSSPDSNYYFAGNGYSQVKEPEKRSVIKRIDTTPATVISSSGYWTNDNLNRNTYSRGFTASKTGDLSTSTYISDFDASKRGLSESRYPANYSSNYSNSFTSKGGALYESPTIPREREYVDNTRKTTILSPGHSTAQYYTGETTYEPVRRTFTRPQGAIREVSNNVIYSQPQSATNYVTKEVMPSNKYNNKSVIMESQNYDTRNTSRNIVRR